MGKTAERIEPKLCFKIWWNLETAKFFSLKIFFKLFDADQVNGYYRMDSDENSAKIFDLPLIDTWNYDFREKPTVEVIDPLWQDVHIIPSVGT